MTAWHQQGLSAAEAVEPQNREKQTACVCAEISTNHSAGRTFVKIGNLNLQRHLKSSDLVRDTNDRAARRGSARRPHRPRVTSILS